ncbi:hypothetical protein FML05_21895 [Klebsiella variicola]|nr:hypothetical protein [Klebsiella variicola]
MSAIWHKLLKLLILHALILVSNILIKVIYSLCELLFQKYVVQARILDEIAPERSQGLSLTKRERGIVPPLRRVNSNGVQKNQLSGLLEMPFQTIPRPINIDAKRANRVVEIKIPVMVVPQKVRMQVIRHGTARKVPCRADYFSVRVCRLMPAS